MRQWVKKLAEQFEVTKQGSSAHSSANDVVAEELSEDRATLSFLIDTYTKHLFDVGTPNLRKTRDMFDHFTRELVRSGKGTADDTLFRLRQAFSSYRITESTYIQKTFDDFKSIIWDFADQLGEDVREEKAQDVSVLKSLGQLREAVESNSIDELRSKSREFINFYVSFQTQKDQARTKRLTQFRKNLASVKKQLTAAHRDMMTDHMTGAYNRKSFDEQIRNHLKLFEIAQTPVTLLILDIDHFKKVNDTYGHDVGDFVIKECVRMVKAAFHREGDFVARIGGEEFAVILPDFSADDALVKVEELMALIRKEVFVQSDAQIRFTISLGIAQVIAGEGTDEWMKRADEALYYSKQNGRNRATIAGLKSIKAA